MIRPILTVVLVAALVGAAQWFYGLGWSDGLVVGQRCEIECQDATHSHGSIRWGVCACQGSGLASCSTQVSGVCSTPEEER